MHKTASTMKDQNHDHNHRLAKAVCSTRASAASMETTATTTTRNRCNMMSAVIKLTQVRLAASMLLLCSSLIVLFALMEAQATSGSSSSSSSSGRTTMMNLPDGIENILGFVPKSSFQCERDGYFGDIDNDCRIFHLCQSQLSSNGRLEWRHWTYACGNQTMFNQLTLTCAFVDEAIPCRHASQFQYLNEVINKPSEPFLTDADVTSGFSYYSNRIMSDGARARAFQDSQLMAQIGSAPSASSSSSTGGFSRFSSNQERSFVDAPRVESERNNFNINNNELSSNNNNNNFMLALPMTRHQQASLSDTFQAQFLPIQPSAMNNFNNFAAPSASPPPPPPPTTTTATTSSEQSFTRTQESTSGPQLDQPVVIVANQRNQQQQPSSFSFSISTNHQPHSLLEPSNGQVIRSSAFEVYSNLAPLPPPSLAPPSQPPVTLATPQQQQQQQQQQPAASSTLSSFAKQVPPPPPPTTTTMPTTTTTTTTFSSSSSSGASSGVATEVTLPVATFAPLAPNRLQQTSTPITTTTTAATTTTTRRTEQIKPQQQQQQQRRARAGAFHSTRIQNQPRQQQQQQQQQPLVMRRSSRQATNEQDWQSSSSGDFWRQAAAAGASFQLGSAPKFESMILRRRV